MMATLSLRLVPQWIACTTLLILGAGRYLLQPPARVALYLIFCEVVFAVATALICLPDFRFEREKSGFRYSWMRSNPNASLTIAMVGFCDALVGALYYYLELRS